jgi:hypothetical protein
LQNGGEFRPGFIFQRINPWTRSMSPWTDGGVDKGGPGRGGALTGARPPAAPVHQSSPARAQKGERSTGSSARASPELGQWCSDQATEVA